jgi:hypothetical protein
MENRLAISDHLELNLRNLASKSVPNLKSRDWTQQIPSLRSSVSPSGSNARRRKSPSGTPLAFQGHGVASNNTTSQEEFWSAHPLLIYADGNAGLRPEF